jgi:alpha-L-fucosidase
VAEYVEAARAEGLRAGLYYSLMDWHHPDGARCEHDKVARERDGVVFSIRFEFGRRPETTPARFRA